MPSRWCIGLCRVPIVQCHFEPLLNVSFLSAERSFNLIFLSLLIFPISGTSSAWFHQHTWEAQRSNSGMFPLLVSFWMWWSTLLWPWKSKQTVSLSIPRLYAMPSQQRRVQKTTTNRSTEIYFLHFYLQVILQTWRVSRRVSSSLSLSYWPFSFSVTSEPSELQMYS